MSSFKAVPIKIGEIELVIISKREYDQLSNSASWYDALYEAGVDNWFGYDYAVDLLREAGFFDE